MSSYGSWSNDEIEAFLENVIFFTEIASNDVQMKNFSPFLIENRKWSKNIVPRGKVSNSGDGFYYKREPRRLDIFPDNTVDKDGFFNGHTILLLDDNGKMVGKRLIKSHKNDETGPWNGFTDEFLFIDKSYIGQISGKYYKYFLY